MYRFALMVLFVVVLAGCGPKRPKAVPVSGRVTLNGGEWPNPGMLYFASTEPAPGFPARSAFANLAPDGSFEAQSFVKGDGLLPGKYVVTIECWKTPAGMKGAAGVSAVPKKYLSQSTSNFFINVDPAQSSIDVQFDVK